MQNPSDGDSESGRYMPLPPQPAVVSILASRTYRSGDDPAWNTPIKAEILQHVVSPIKGKSK